MSALLEKPNSLPHRTAALIFLRVRQAILAGVLLLA